MPGIQSLPFELVCLVTKHLKIGELAAFARTSHKVFDIVDPVLYETAKETLDRFDSWHPIRWAAEQGQAGTMRKALAADMDPEMIFADFHSRTDRADRDKRLRKIRQKAIDRQLTPISSVTDADVEWQPQPGHADEDVLEEQFDTDYLDLAALAEPTADDSDDLESDDEFSESVYDYFEHIIDPLDDETYNNPMDTMMPRFRALHLAAARGHDEVIQTLLDHGVEIESSCHDTCDCAFSGPRMFGAATDELQAQPARMGLSALHLAICFFQKSTVRLLLSRGASIQLTSLESPMTALHSAAATGQSDLCQLLLDQNYVQDIDILDSNKLSPFYWAYLNGHWNTTVPFLLERGANIDLQIPGNLASITSTEYTLTCTILYEAIHCGRLQDAIKLIHLGANIHEGEYSDSERYDTPLHAASTSSVSSFSEPLYNPPIKLSYAVDEEHLRSKLLCLLIQAGAKIDARSPEAPEENGFTPLHYAAQHKLTTALEILLAAGANVHLRDHMGMHALLIVCLPPWGSWETSEDERRWEAHKELHMIRLLLDHGSSVNATNHHEKTALHLICSINDLFMKKFSPRAELTRLLLDRGANTTARCEAGKTPLRVAYECGALDVCDILIRRQRPTQALDQYEPEDMWTHSFQNRPSEQEAFDLLYDLDTEGYLWKSSKYVMRMMAGRKFDLAWTYLRRKLPPLTPKEKAKILHQAIRSCLVDMIERLVATKPPMHEPDELGNTPLYNLICCIEEERDLRLLVAHFLVAGADPHHPHYLRSLATPVEEAIRRGPRSVDIVDLMLCHCPLMDRVNTTGGNYLHLAAGVETNISKHMFIVLIRAGAEVTALDDSGNTPLAVYLKRILEGPSLLSQRSGLEDIHCLAIRYLWDQKIDVERKNKLGKSILSYLTALRLYSGDCQRRAKVAEILRTCIQIVPLPGNEGRKTLRFSSWFVKQDRELS